MLDHRVSAADISRLILTSGHERLLSAATPLAGPEMIRQRVLNGLLDREIRDRIRVLEEAVTDLAALIGRWPANAAYTVADTGVYRETTRLYTRPSAADMQRAVDLLTGDE
jgi:hypothetical protein